MFAFKMPGLSDMCSHASIHINLLLMLGSENGFLFKNSTALPALLALIEFTGHSETPESVLK